jgi:hypothetical protein
MTEQSTPLRARSFIQAPNIPNEKVAIPIIHGNIIDRYMLALGQSRTGTGPATPSGQGLEKLPSSRAFWRPWRGQRGPQSGSVIGWRSKAVGAQGLARHLILPPSEQGPGRGWKQWVSVPASLSCSHLIAVHHPAAPASGGDVALHGRLGGLRGELWPMRPGWWMFWRSSSTVCRYGLWGGLTWSHQRLNRSSTGSVKEAQLAISLNLQCARVARQEGQSYTPTRSMLCQEPHTLVGY